MLPVGRAAKRETKKDSYNCSEQGVSRFTMCIKYLSGKVGTPRNPTVTNALLGLHGLFSSHHPPASKTANARGRLFTVQGNQTFSKRLRTAAICPESGGLMELRWELSFNAFKTQLCRFSRIRKTQSIQLHQGSFLLQEQTRIRYLGRGIDAAGHSSNTSRTRKPPANGDYHRFADSVTAVGAHPLVTKRPMDMCVLPSCLYAASAVFGPLSRGRSSRRANPASNIRSSSM